MADENDVKPTGTQPPAATDQQPPAGAGAEGGDLQQAVPYARFKEINDARKQLEQRLAQIEAAQTAAAEKELLEQKKYQELADKYKTELETERMSRLRLETAAKHGLPVEMAGRLQGANADELAADAQALAAFLKPAAPGNLPRHNGQPAAAPTTAQMSDPKWVRENMDKLWPK